MAGGIWIKFQCEATFGMAGCDETCAAPFVASPCENGNIDMNYFGNNDIAGMCEISPCGCNVTPGDGGYFGAQGTCGQLDNPSMPYCSGASGIPYEGAQQNQQTCEENGGTWTQNYDCYPCVESGCEVTPEILCNYFYSDCNDACTSVEDDACNAYGAFTQGYNCIPPDGDTDPNDPWAGHGLGYGSGDATGDGSLDVNDVVAIVTWVICGDSPEGIIPEGSIEYGDCQIQCFGASCPPSGLIDPIYITQDLLLNADTNQDGKVNVLDAIQIVDQLLADTNTTSRERNQINRELQKLSTHSRRRKGRVKPSSRRMMGGGKANTNSRFSGRSQTNPKGKFKK